MDLCLSIRTNNNGSSWVKKHDHMFEVTMESCMGAEYLVKLFLLQYLQEVLTPGRQISCPAQSLKI